MGKLFCAAPSLFAKEVLFAEVFTQVFVVTAERREAELQPSQRVCREGTANGAWQLPQDEARTSSGARFFLYPQARFPAETTRVQSAPTLRHDPRGELNDPRR